MKLKILLLLNLCLLFLGLQTVFAQAEEANCGIEAGIIDKAPNVSNNILTKNKLSN